LHDCDADLSALQHALCSVAPSKNINTMFLAPLTYQWSANGAILKTTGPNLTFACSSPGDIAIQIALSDGDSSPGCVDHLSVNIRCDLP
jgi:hypothetical protein